MYIFLRLLALCVCVYLCVCVFYRDHHQFILLCMRLLSIHLSLAHAGGTGAIVLGAQGRPLRKLLFRLIDTNMPESIKQVIMGVAAKCSDYCLLTHNPDNIYWSWAGYRFQLEILQFHAKHVNNFN